MAFGIAGKQWLLSGDLPRVRREAILGAQDFSEQVSGLTDGLCDIYIFSLSVCSVSSA